jgi:concanavalin A-like lectin/glucanase superfamily protein
MNDHFKNLALSCHIVFLILLLGGVIPAAQAGLLATQNNPVSFGANYWGDPAVWDSMGIPKFPLDTPSDGTLERDVSYISIVHDTSFYYVRIHAAQGPAFGGDYNLWLDIDNNPATGQRHWTGNGAIGAERLITGAALIQNIPAWTIAWLNWDQSSWDSAAVARDVFFSINRATQMPGVNSFDFTFQFYSTPNSATGDWYPDAADSQSGDFFRYNAGTEQATNFSGRTWTAVVQQTPLPSMGGQYDPIQTNSYSTPNANTGLITGRFGIDSSMTVPISLNVGDTVEYDFFITSETRDFTGNNPDTWFGATGTGFQDASGNWVTDHNLRFSDSRWEDYFVSPSGATDEYAYQARAATQATHVKWVFTSLTTATVTLTLAGDTTAYATFTNTFSNIGNIARFQVGLLDSEQDVTLAKFTVTPAATPPPSVLVFSGRAWTPLISVASAQYSPPQTNQYAASNPNTGLMTGRFGVDTAMTTPLTLAVGDKVSYDYFLTEESRNFRGTGASTYVGDSRTGFQDASGNWVSGRIATYDSRWDQYFEGNNPQSVSHARGYPWSIHVEWVFTSATTATVTLTLAGEATPFAVWNDTFSNIANIAKFRVGLWDSEQDVVLANFTVSQRTGSLVVEHFWHVGEDGQVLPTDAVGFKPLTAGFGTRAVDTAVYAPSSSASLRFSNADGGDYMNSLSDAIFVPPDNWVLELWVNPASSDFGSGVSLVTLGSETGTTQIGMVGGKWYFGEMNITYGDNSQSATASAWTHLAWVRDAGVNRFFVGGTQIGSNGDSATNNGRIHLFIKPGGGEVPEGNVDEIRFSTFTSGQFNANDLLVNTTPVVTNHAPIVRWDNPVAFWRLGEASGSTAVDNVGGHDGTYNGTLTYGVAGALAGDPDTAIEFDGASGYVGVPFSAALNPQGPFSVEAWVRPNSIPDSAGTPCPVSSAQFSGNRSGWQIRERDTGWQFVLYAHSSSTVANDGLANTAHGGVPSTTSWTHLAGIYDGVSTFLYINGVAYSSSASGYVANYNDGVNAAGPFTIGARSSLNNYFPGSVDEVAFYNRALSSAEVLSHYLDRPRLTIRVSGSNVILEWPVGTLQQADQASGTYTDVAGSSPRTLPAGAGKKFYRVKL